MIIQHIYLVGEEPGVLHVVLVVDEPEGKRGRDEVDKIATDEGDEKERYGLSEDVVPGEGQGGGEINAVQRQIFIRVMKNEVHLLFGCAVVVALTRAASKQRFSFFELFFWATSQHQCLSFRSLTLRSA
jgi:hypothetical protein